MKSISPTIVNNILLGRFMTSIIIINTSSDVI